MSGWVVAVLMAPFVTIVVVFGVVVVVALVRADRGDVPSVMRESTSVFRRLADRAGTAQGGTGENR